MHLFGRQGGHGGSKIAEFTFGFFKAITDFFDNIGKVVLNMCEENLGKFVGKHITSKETGRHR